MVRPFHSPLVQLRCTRRGRVIALSSNCSAQKEPMRMVRGEVIARWNTEYLRCTCCCHVKARGYNCAALGEAMQKAAGAGAPHMVMPQTQYWLEGRANLTPHQKVDPGCLACANRAHVEKEDRCGKIAVCHVDVHREVWSGHWTAGFISANWASLCPKATVPHSDDVYLCAQRVYELRIS